MLRIAASPKLWILQGLVGHLPVEQATRLLTWVAGRAAPEDAILLDVPNERAAMRAATGPMELRVRDVPAWLSALPLRSLQLEYLGHPAALVLRNIFEHLRPGGALAIHITNAWSVPIDGDPLPRLQGAGRDRLGRAYERLARLSPVDVDQKVELTHVHRLLGSGESYTSRSRLRLLHRSECVSMLTQAGFSVAAIEPDRTRRPAGPPPRRDAPFAGRAAPTVRRVQTVRRWIEPAAITITSPLPSSISRRCSPPASPRCSRTSLT